ncbi:hypothetical protein Tco_0828791 [Tanacetum coccineum]
MMRCGSKFWKATAKIFASVVLSGSTTGRKIYFSPKRHPGLEEQQAYGMLILRYWRLKGLEDGKPIKEVFYKDSILSQCSTRTVDHRSHGSEVNATDR